MSWYATSWQHMLAKRDEAGADTDSAEIAKAIDASYPFSQRSGLAYKAWLEARRDFFRQYNLPMRRAKKPADGLFSGQQEPTHD